MNSNAEHVTQQAKRNGAFPCDADPRWFLIGISNAEIHSRSLAGAHSDLCSAFQSGYLLAIELWLEGSMEGKKHLIYMPPYKNLRSHMQKKNLNWAESPR